MSIITFPNQYQTIVAEPRAPRRTLGFLAVWAARRKYRAMLRNELLAQPDSVLEDAGFTRSQARIEAHKPFWQTCDPNNAG